MKRTFGKPKSSQQGKSIRVIGQEINNSPISMGYDKNLEPFDQKLFKSNRTRGV